MHRGVYELGREATEQFEGARERIAAFVGWDPSCSIFTRNATEAINLVAYAWGRHNLGPGDEVLDHRDGAPLEHRALAAGLRGRGAAALLSVGEAASCRSTSSTPCSPRGT